MAEVGRAVGETVGFEVVGRKLGLSVGCEVVGAGVVGICVGAVAGAADGVEEGTGVVGAAVGAAVFLTQQCRPPSPLPVLPGWNRQQSLAAPFGSMS